MCNPMALASAAATIGGSIMQSRSQAKAQSAINAAINETGEANRRLQQESQGKVGDAAKDFGRENFDATQADETGKLQTQFKDNLSQGALPGEYYGGPQDDNTRAYRELKSKDANNFSQMMAEKLANLRGFDQGFQVKGRGVQRAAEGVAMNSGFQDGNNAVLPLKIEAAKQKGQNLFADILTGVGSAGMSAGLSSAAGGTFGGITDTQGGFSRFLSGGSADMQGPMKSFGGFKLA